MPKTKTIADETIIAALLSCSTLEVAANQCGISVRQLFERRQNPDFVRKLTEAQTEALATTTRYLQHATGSAAATLLEIAESTVKPAQVRVAAARTILDAAARYTEIVDYGARLDALERYAKGEEDEQTTEH